MSEQLTVALLVDVKNLVWGSQTKINVDEFQNS